MSQREVNTTAVLVLASTLILCLATVLLVRCAARPDDITPTLAISETPSITPEATATATPTLSASATPVVTVAVSPPATGTAVTPPDTHTAVPTATPTSTPTPTATDERLLIVKGMNYWDSSKAKYGRFECWQMLKRVNGWPERSLPIGEYMRLPETCE